MKNLHNIEPSAFRRGEYIGHADGVWRIVKRDGIWRAIHAEGKFWSAEARTLAELSEKLNPETLEVAQ